MVGALLAIIVVILGVVILGVVIGAVAFLYLTASQER